MTPVYVLWEDAAEMDHTSWVSRDEKHDSISPILVHEVGYMLHEDDKHIVLTSAYTDYQVGRRTQIPKGMVRKIKYLK